MRIFFLVLACVLPLYALAIGEQYGRIGGFVSNAEGESLAQARLRLTSPLLFGGARTLLSSTDGRFSFNNLSPGKYQLKVEKDGFKTMTKADLVVSVGKTTSINPIMESLSIEPLVICNAMPGFEGLCQPAPKLKNLGGEGPTQKASKKYGRISGVLYNRSGGAPNIELTLSSPFLLGGSKKAYSCEDGFYSFGNLIPGEYLLTIGYPGTKMIQEERFTVVAGGTMVLSSEVKFPGKLIKPAACSEPEAKYELYSNMGTFLNLDLISQGLGARTIEDTRDAEFKTIDITVMSGLPNPVPVFTQGSPKQGQSVDSFVVQLPTLEVRTGTILIKKKAANLVVDGVPYTRMGVSR